MTPDRWSRVKTLFNRVVQLAPEQRDTFLKTECGTDTELLNELQNLLTSYDEGGILDTPGTDTLADTELDSRLGQLLQNRYRVLQKLGSGGIGVVYKAQDLHLHSRPVVVKFLHETSIQDSGRLIKFRQEMEALARLSDHPGIVTAFDAGETADGKPYLVMQYVEGRTLRQLMDQGRLPLARAAEILQQLGDALSFAHSKRILHRDLKPENVMLQDMGDSREVVKLIDFGIARVRESQVTADTAFVPFAGTPAYMAPEHLFGKPVEASDIWSLGVIAFEMLTGERPFTTRSVFSLRDQQRRGVAKGSVRKLRPEVPEAVEATIRSSLCYEASERPQNARDLCGRIAHELRTAAPAVSRRGIWLGAGAAAVFAVGGAAWFFAPKRDSDDAASRPASRRGNVLAENIGAGNPRRQGFRPDGDINGEAVRNDLKTGFDRWRMWTSEQGSYNRHLSVEEVAEALRRGWKISLRGLPVEGGMWACVDFGPGHPRYDVNHVIKAPGRVEAGLCTQHIPTFEGPAVALLDGLTKPYLLELIYRPENRSCDLLINREMRVSGYRGHDQQKKPAPTFFFGTSVYRSSRAEAILDLVRFELT
jgi:serine/threonine protein kinase